MTNRARPSGFLSSKSVPLLFASLGIIARIGIVLVSGNQLTNSLSGGGDAPAYLRLADSLYKHQGFSYVGQPSAFRPPLYPILLDGAHLTFGEHYIFAVRVLQLVAGIGMAWLCAVIAQEIWGVRSRNWCFALALIFPTLVYFTGEILTETFASFMAVLFLLFLVRSKSGRMSDYVCMGLVAGLAALLRFNMIFLPFIAGWRVLSTLKNGQRSRALLVVSFIPFCILLPWMIRNLVVFHGEVIYSTHTGMDLVEGIIEPEGRADQQQQQQILREAGWQMQGLERTDSLRLRYPSEPELNRQAMRAAVRLWRDAGWHGVKIILQKIGYFWLSTDQLVSISHFSRRVQLLRIAGVGFYWLSLAVAVAGMKKLLRVDVHLAHTLIIYVVIATGLHLLFAMNTRLRVPLVDPLICVLATYPFATSKRESSTGQTDVAPVLQEA